MQLTRCKNVEPVHLWISYVDAMEWKNKGGEYYGMEEYFGQCAAIMSLGQEEPPRRIIITINTTADIFALNEPFKRYMAGVKPPALYSSPKLLEGHSAVSGEIDNGDRRPDVVHPSQAANESSHRQC